MATQFNSVVCLTVDPKVRDQSSGEVGDVGGACPEGLGQAEVLRSYGGKTLGKYRLHRAQ